MLPKSLHTVRVLQVVALLIERAPGAHKGAQAVHAAAAHLGYLYTVAEGEADPTVARAIAGLDKARANGAA